jgi:molecular chaperone DnaJ
MDIQVTVETPVNLTRRQRELLRDFEKESHENVFELQSGLDGTS